MDESSEPQVSPIPCSFDEFKVNGTVCDDGNACTLDDACEDGNCAGPVCPGSTPCKTVYCDNFNGADQCAVSYAPVGADCEDGDFCTENDQCESPQDNVVTVCLGADISCDDGNPCTNDTCVPTGECTYEPALEGVSCKTAGVCIQGECCQDSCIGSGSFASCGFSSCGTACGTCLSEGSTCVESTCVATDVPTGMQLVQPGLSELGCSDSGESEACDLAFIEGDESPEVFVYLSAFAIDTFEVTVGDFDAFLIDIGGVDVSCGSVQPGPCVALNEAAWANLVSQGLFLPASHVTWLGASEYCASKSRRLCTEAEWEKAARGAGGKWPWGVSPDPNPEAPCVFASHGGVCGSGPSVIGTYQDGASAIGAHDMAGNVAEWTADTYAADIYQSYVDSGLITYNPTGSLSAQGIRVLRGGSFASPLKDLTTTARAFAPFDLQGVDSTSSTPGVVLGADEIGFRCCADVEIPSSP